MQRRNFIKLLGGAAAAAWPLAVRAQQPERVRRIGVLIPFTADDPEARERTAVFEQSLRQLGWTVGRNLQIEQRLPGGEAASIRHAAAELVALGPGPSGNWHHDRWLCYCKRPRPSQSYS